MRPAQRQERVEQRAPDTPAPRLGHDIIERMGARFYYAVFMPAISEARDEGKSYETIRDTIRRGWKPARATSRKNNASICLDTPQHGSAG